MPSTRRWHSLHTQQNADSVEFLPLHAGAEDEDMRTFVCGNYQLNETTREKTGRIYLFQLEAPAPAAAQAEGSAAAACAAAPVASSAESFTCPSAPRLVQQQVLDTAAIFDLKWAPRLLQGKQLLGQADASGALLLYEWSRAGAAASVGASAASAAAPSAAPSSSLRLVHETQADEKASCLSLDWSNRVVITPEPLLAVSHSNSMLSLWQLQQDGGWNLAEQRRWLAHEYEVWIAHFDAHSGGNVLYSGADDCRFRGWDLRGPTVGPRSAVFSDESSHGMGVCSIASHPSRAHVLATGSYDESVRLWDTRNLRKPVLVAEHALGGGVWRVRWNNGDEAGATPPAGKSKRDSLLCAAMHNGFAVVDVDFAFAASDDGAQAAAAGEKDELPSRLAAASIEPVVDAAAAPAAGAAAFPTGASLSTVATYKAHQSLAYGADWCAQPCSWLRRDAAAAAAEPQGLSTEVIATCSFYDKQLDVWSVDMQAEASVVTDAAAATPAAAAPASPPAADAPVAT